jgi:hypothetical protein
MQNSDQHLSGDELQSLDKKYLQKKKNYFCEERIIGSLLNGWLLMGHNTVIIRALFREQC